MKACISLIFLMTVAITASLVGMNTTRAPASEDACAFCDGKDAFECQRCEGKGSRQHPCPTCHGRKKVDCPVQSCEGGRALCGNCGGTAYVEWNTGAKDVCKVCRKKGRLTCSVCAGKRKVPCPPCEGKGRLTSTCAACMGVGHHPCPKATDEESCGGCRGSRKMPCLRCSGRDSVAVRCDRCQGHEKVFCTECTHGIAPCKYCHGTGVIRQVMSGSGSSAGSTRCTTCKGKGYGKCSRCGEKGTLTCRASDHRKDCPDCRYGSRTCPVCR